MIEPRGRAERLPAVILAIAIAAAAIAAIVWLTGTSRIQIFGIHVSISPLRAALVALAAFGLYGLLWRDAARARIVAVSRAVRPGWIAMLLAVVTGIAGVRWTSTVAGGSDSYGYVSEAALWRSGTLVVHQPIVDAVPWPLAPETFMPLGYTRSRSERDAIVPTYPPGYPLLMAAAQLVGGYCAAFLVVPLCGAAVVWLTFVLARTLTGSGWLAVASAVVMAVSPPFLNQLLSPMSDVPATMCVTLAVVLAIAEAPIWTGVAIGAASAIRPNLILVSLPIAAWMCWRARHDSRRTAVRTLLRVTIGIAPFIVALAVVNARLFASPWATGYGPVASLYSWTYVPANAANFTLWTLETETPAIVIALLAFAPTWKSPLRVPAAAGLLIGVIAVVIASYLCYQPFEDWLYLRFLLPIWPLALVLTIASIGAVASGSIRSGLVAVCVAVMASHGLRWTVREGVLEAAARESRYVDVARHVQSHTNPRDVILASQHSGSIRHYAGRITARFEWLEPEWLDRAVVYLRASGRRVFVVLDPVEADAFRERFGRASSLGRLDWAPAAQSTVGLRVTIYELGGPDRSMAPILPTSRNRNSGWPCERPSPTPPDFRP